MIKTSCLIRQASSRGLSVNAVSKGSGVSQPAVWRFVAGEPDLKMETADRRFIEWFRFEKPLPRQPI